MNIVFDHLPALWHGLVKTLGLTFFGFLIGCGVGAVIAICRVSPIRPLRAFGAVYVGLMVNSPLLFLMVVAFYGVPKLGLLVNGYRTAVVVIGLYVGGYVAEALRAGINTVPNGQAEAARSIGLTFAQTLRHIVLPQAVRSSLGPLGVLLNATYRNVAVAGAIGVIEFVKAGRDISEQTAQAVPFFLAQFAVFAVLGLSTSYGAQWLDHRFAVKR
jgi:glutamate transport system permease protein